jgi:glycogen operon protein
VDLCLFATTADHEELERHPLERDRQGVWRLYLPDIGPGQLYGYRVQGPWKPEAGHRFDPAKLLVDPCAHALSGDYIVDPSLTERSQDSTPFVPKSLVVDPRFDWQDDQPPATPWRETVIYECHVRGMTRLHPDLPEELRGTYLGLVEPPVLDHLSSLGVTAVEEMPGNRCRSSRPWCGVSTGSASR